MNETQIQAQSVDQLTDYLASLSQPMSLEFGERVQRAVLVREASRLVKRMDAFDKGVLGWLSLAEALEVAELAWSSTTMRRASCVVHCDRLREIDEPGAEQAIGVLLDWVRAAPRKLEASLLLLFDSEMDLTKDPAALGLAMAAWQRGWGVAAGSAKDDVELVRIDLRSTADEAFSLAATESAEGVISVVRFGLAEQDGSAAEPVWAERAERWREIVVPDRATNGVAGSPSEVLEASLSVTDLFGEQIMLRDIEPRSRALEGIEEFRGELGWDSTYVPRKNEPEYGRALLRIMGGARAEGPSQIVYVGDTLLNDGGAIRGLQEAGPPRRVWGFLCGATKTRPERDFALDRIYFGAEWGSLSSFIDYARKDGLSFDESTWVLFDLDQTVYAAKGRDDEPLLRARWDAVRGYLEEVVPEYKFDAARAEALYREFDRDEYHPVTRDNLDYVVLLVLSVASGLADATEIREYASSSRPSIGALAEELRRRAAMRLGHEEISAVLDAVKAVHYNTMAGDQTPCKDFRRYECLAMAARMRGDVAGDRESRIFLNREVVDLIKGLRQTPAQLFAVSDRPVEAAVAELEDEEPVDTDLMTVPMAIRGLALPELSLVKG
jgi:FMN phosphatase YigB (HAD superfamily)